MALVLVTSDRFADHLTPPGHPERVERAEAMQVVAARFQEGGGTVIAPREAADEDLERVHRGDYLESIRELRGHAGMLDADTFVSPESDDVARLAAGSVLTAIDYVLDDSERRAFAMVRPPGHHAEADRGMGFCLYNSVAVGAAYARARGLERVAIVDYDVHHGNGTQWMFYGDPSVLFVSSHQFPFYPGTGAAGETGQGAGTGRTVNFPLEVGATDADYDLVYCEVGGMIEEFRPQLLLISAGFDAHERDPLAGMRMTTNGFGNVTSRLLLAADACCDGRVVFVTEGGYDTQALAECCQRVIDIAGQDLVATPMAIRGDTRRATATLQAVRTAQRDHWKSLR